MLLGINININIKMKMGPEVAQAVGPGIDSKR